MHYRVGTAKNPYTLVKIRRRSGTVWYYRLADDSKRTMHSTAVKGVRNEYLTRQWIEEHALNINGPGTTFGQYAKDVFVPGRCAWTARQRSRSRGSSLENTQHRRGPLENHLKPRFEKIRMTDITAPMFERWWTHLPLSNQTKNHIKYTMNIGMTEAKRDRVIRENPIADVEPMGKAQHTCDVLTLEELGKLFPTSGQKFREIWPLPRVRRSFRAHGFHGDPPRRSSGPALERRGMESGRDPDL